MRRPSRSGGFAAALHLPIALQLFLTVSGCTVPTRDYSAFEGGAASSLQNAGGSAAAGRTATASGGALGDGGAVATAGAGVVNGGTSSGGLPNGNGGSVVGGTTSSDSGGGTSSSSDVGGTTGLGGSGGTSSSSNVGGTTSDASGGTSSSSNAGGTNSSGGMVSLGGNLASGGTTSNLGGSGFGGNTGKQLGDGCAVGAECASLNCVDGVCCTESACPECMNCGTAGLCANRVTNQTDGSGKICSGNRSCDASGICKTLAGRSCSTDAECFDGFCSDGVCCKSRCGGLCQTCDTAGTCQRTVLREDDSCRTDSTGVRMCDSLSLCSMPHLVKDINPLAVTVGGITNTLPSYPRSFTEGPDRRVYFSATDGTSGEELWVTDGTAAGTVMVADILPNIGNGAPRGLVNAGSNLFFSAFDATGYAKLFATNGTAAGTRLVKDLGTSGFGGNALSARAVGNVIYFTGCGMEAGCELWRSDGTNTGTVMVADIMGAALPATPTQTFGSNPAELTVMGGAVYFRAANAVIGVGTTNTIADFELWKSDGTATNTVRVADIEPGVANSSPTALAVLPGVSGPRLIFSAAHGATNQELYVTDGSAGNLSTVDINPGASGSFPGPFVMLGNRAYFAATDANSGRELWTTDGTALGTYLVRDIYPGPAGGGPMLLAAAGNFIYFQATDGSSTGSQLWRTDGTSNGTSKLYSNFTPSGTGLLELAALGNQVFMSTAGGVGTQELWVTDGTTAGTYRSCPDRSQPCGSPFASNPSALTVIGGHMYFNATGSPSSGASLGAEPFVYP